jgi:hypothetical protein
VTSCRGASTTLDRRHRHAQAATDQRADALGGGGGAQVVRERGLVERVGDHHDREVVLVATPRGVALGDRAVAVGESAPGAEAHDAFVVVEEDRSPVEHDRVGEHVHGLVENRSEVFGDDRRLDDTVNGREFAQAAAQLLLVEARLVPDPCQISLQSPDCEARRPARQCADRRLGARNRGRPAPEYDRGVQIARVERWAELPAALADLGIEGPRPVVVLVGGADGIDSATATRLEAAFERVAAVAAAAGAAVVDGATDTGIGRLIGRARAASAGFTLVGIAVESLVVEPGEEPHGEQAALEPNHSHLLLVPGARWGDEVPWLQHVAGLLAGDAPTVTVLANGGDIALADVEESVASGRRVLVLAGSGRTADRIAAALEGLPAEARIEQVAASGLVEAIAVGEDTGAAVERAFEATPAAGR